MARNLIQNANGMKDFQAFLRWYKPDQVRRGTLSQFSDTPRHLNNKIALCYRLNFDLSNIFEMYTHQISRYELRNFK